MPSRRDEQAIVGPTAHPAGAYPGDVHKASLLTALSVASTLWSASAFAVGLGEIQVESAIGQPLRGAITLFGSDADTAAPECIKATMASLDGAFIIAPRINFTSAGHSSTLTLSTTNAINEPAFTLLVDVDCGSRIQRTYPVLLDPQPTLPPAPTPQRDPVTVPAVNGKPDTSSARSAAADVGTSQQQEESARPATARAVSRIREPLPKQKSAIRITRTAPSPEPIRNVLRLTSSPIADKHLFDSAGLKLALATSMRPGASAAAASAGSLHLANGAVAESLHDNFGSTEKQRVTVQSKIHALEYEIARSEQMHDRDRVADRVAERVELSAAKGNASTMQWLAGLGTLLAAMLGAMAWLTWRINRIAKGKARPGWEDWASTRIDHGVGPWILPDKAEDETDLNHLAKYDTAATYLQHRSPDLGIERNDVRVTSQVEGRRDDMHTDAYTVEEIQDAMQQAEFWTTLNNWQMAVDVLEFHVQGHDGVQRSPLPWLLLFDLYRKLGAQEKYVSMLEQFRGLFNGNVPEWHEDPALEQPCGLEDIPHLVEVISASWGTDSVIPFMEGLLIDDRGGERAGFDLPVYRDILFLIQIAQETQRS